MSSLKDGDSNKFFHKATVCRRARNLFKEMRTDDGRTLNMKAEITKHFHDHLQQMANSGCTCSAGGDGGDTLDKALGPDGLLAEFYRRYWDVVGSGIGHACFSVSRK